MFGESIIAQKGAADEPTWRQEVSDLGAITDHPIAEQLPPRMHFLDISLHTAHTLYSNEAHLMEQLPRVDLLKPPATVVGTDTISCIQSGIIFGYAGLVDGIVDRMKAELQTTPKVIATGGLAPLIRDVSHSIEAVESDLTLEGLRIISDELA